MTIYLLNEELVFPDVFDAEDDGLLAVGGDLSPERLILAYKSGIFPWFNDDKDYILWWALNPRMVLFPNEFKYSHSLKKRMKQNNYEIRVNTAFSEVLKKCSETPRFGQSGTWITPNMQNAYLKLYELGYAYSIETWIDNQLVGGLYGIKIKDVFCGESMFSTVTDSSKMAFAYFLLYLVPQWEIKIIDCQMYTKHLASLGGREIELKEYLKYLNNQFKS